MPPWRKAAALRNFWAPELPVWSRRAASPLSLPTCYPTRQLYNSVLHFCTLHAPHSSSKTLLRRWPGCPPRPRASRLRPYRRPDPLPPSLPPLPGNGPAMVMAPLPPAAPGRERRWGGWGLRADPGVGRPCGSCGVVMFSLPVGWSGGNPKKDSSPQRGRGDYGCQCRR